MQLSVKTWEIGGGGVVDFGWASVCGYWHGCYSHGTSVPHPLPFVGLYSRHHVWDEQFSTWKIDSNDRLIANKSLFQEFKDI